jgi:hypothetical protein
MTVWLFPASPTAVAAAALMIDATSPTCDSICPARL